MDAEAIIPAFNEAPTVAAVARTLVAARVFRRVVVWSDGSHDTTCAMASVPGVEVVCASRNLGKGGAMRAALETTRAPWVAFFDGDLYDLVPAHVHQLLAGIGPGVGQVCGLRDYGPLYNRVQRAMPLITGERVVRRDVLHTVPRAFWQGFRIEAGINEAVARAGLRSATVVFPGVSVRTKWDKQGAQGYADMARMLCDVAQAIDDARHATFTPW